MKFLPVLIMVFLSACASIVESDRQSIFIDTPSCPDAKCRLVNEQGQYYMPLTPGTVTVNKSTTPMSISCSKGGISETITIESATEGMAFGNLLFGGVVGGIVDVSTGAAYVYPPSVSHPLDCESLEEEDEDNDT